MRIILTLAFIVIELLCSAQNLEINAWNDFEGIIGDDEIQLSLYCFEGDELLGNYCYQQNPGKIELQGKLTGNKIELTEAENTINGTFKGLLDNDKLTCLKGEWTNKNQSKPFILYLQAVCIVPNESRYSIALEGTTMQIEHFVKNVKTAILQQNKSWLAGHIFYPIQVKIKEQNITINTQKQFVENFDVIFYKEFRKKVSTFYTHNLFCNWRGVMLGNGDIWINGFKYSNNEEYRYCISGINN